MLSAQAVAFHTAIMDTCRRAKQPEHSDAMALWMYGKALAMGRLQLTMLAMAEAAPAEPEPHEPGLYEAAPSEPEPPEPESCEAILRQPKPPEPELAWTGRPPNIKSTRSRTAR